MADLSYHPVVADADELLADGPVARLLVAGDRVPNAIERAANVRMLGDPAVKLPVGCYRFGEAEGTAMLVVHDGAPAAAPTGSEWSAADDDPLIQAYGWFCTWWDDALEVPPPRFAAGDEAILIPGGQEAKVRRRAFSHGSWFYTVRVDGRTTEVQDRSLGVAEHDDDPYDWIVRPPVSSRAFAATLTRAKLQEQLSDTVYSFRATRTLFRPYQFRPVMRLLETGGLKLLIADEVGLGKTIEAGLVWTELDARRQADRVLVVCPSMLVAKWRAEMDERFGFDLMELDRTRLAELLDRVEKDSLPTRFHAVCSLERLRIWSGLDRLAEIGPHFDLVIVDEAHALRNSGTRSHALGALLSDWTDALLFLSATPLNLGNSDLYNLLELLSPGEFDNEAALELRLEPNEVLNRVSASLLDSAVTNAMRLQWLDEIETLRFGPAVVSRPEYAALRQLFVSGDLNAERVVQAKRYLTQLHALSTVVTRTRKVEVEERKAVREPHPIDVAWTDEEAAFYQAVENWQLDRAARLGLPVGFATQMPLRLASSCLQAARLQILAGADARWSAEDLDPTDEEEPDDGPPPHEVVEMARDLGDVDTKCDEFLRALLPMVAEGHRVLVFTFSRATLAYLERRLSEHVRLATMHGGVARDQRHDVMRQFRAHEFDVLLASRVASEGLDFEFCSAVVNYDLPWNPMEVEQRIGRVDRFGQENDKVIIVNFHTPGTIETDIVQRVLDRIGVFTASIGELEPILQSQINDLRRAEFDFTLTPEQRERRVNEVLAAIEEQRVTATEVEEAAAYLSSTDDAEIAGLEDQLLTRGRYVGQPELVLLLEDWVAGSNGGRLRRSSDDKRVTLRGTAELEVHLRGVQAAAERSAAEIDGLARSLRNEQDITLCLDQETARVTGEPILSANHPLTRAALRVPGHKRGRFAQVALRSDDAASGIYLVVIAIARWTGLRAANEFWTEAVRLDGPPAPSDVVGAALLAALAEAQLEPVEIGGSFELESALEQAQGRLRDRQIAEGERRRAENEAFATARRISHRETHQRKVEQIERRIATLRAAGNTNVIHLQEAQLNNQQRLLEEAMARLDAAAEGSLQIEYLAVAMAQVTSE